MPITATSTVRTISTELFEEALAKTAADLPGKLHVFIDEASRLGVYAEQKKTLFLLARAAGVEAALKLGYVDTAGRLWTDVVSSSTAAPAPARQYLQTLAHLIGGSIAGSEKYPRVVNSRGVTPPVAEFLDVYKAGWLGAIQAFIAQTQAVASASEDDR